MEWKVRNRSRLSDITVSLNLTPLLVFETRVKDLWLGFGSWHPICQTTYHYDYWIEYSNLFSDSNTPGKELMYQGRRMIYLMYLRIKEKNVFLLEGMLLSVNSFLKRFVSPKLCIRNKVNPSISRTLGVNCALIFEIDDISFGGVIIPLIHRSRRKLSKAATYQKTLTFE